MKRYLPLCLCLHFLLYILPTLLGYFNILSHFLISNFCLFYIPDDPEFWQDAKSDTGHRRPVMFFQVVYMAPRQPDVYPYYVNVSYTRVSEVRQLTSWWSAGLGIERLPVHIRAGAAGEFSSPELTLCADFIWCPFPPVLPQ